MIKSLTSIALSLSLIACGSGGGGGGSGSSPAPTVSSTQKAYATAANLPDCAAALEGNLAYVKDQAILSYCESGEWVPANLGGDSEMALTSRTLCQSQSISQTYFSDIGLNAAPADGAMFTYEIMEFEGGMAMITATIILKAQSLSASVIRHSTQGSFKTMTSPSITLDMHGTAGFGYWTFKKDSALSGSEAQPYAAVYKDAELGSDAARPFYAGECVTE